MRICLSFSLAQNETSNKAEFPSIELKNAYVEAEFHNLACQKAYFEFQAARMPNERKHLATIIDDTRYAFFQRWAKQHLPHPKFPPMRPVDDIA